jgi:hypothetical protein
MIENLDLITASLQLAVNKYGKDFSKLLECLFRNETGHFTSGQWLNCNLPGMEATEGGPTWGWGTLLPFWEANPQYAPTSVWCAVDNASALSPSTGKQSFIIAPSIEAGILTVAYLINARGGNFGSWFSTDPSEQEKYVGILNTIIPRIVDTLNQIVS